MGEEKEKGFLAVSGGKKRARSYLPSLCSAREKDPKRPERDRGKKLVSFSFYERNREKKKEEVLLRLHRLVSDHQKMPSPGGEKRRLEAAS